MIEQENKESIARTVRLAGATENVEVILPLPEKETAIGWSDDERSIINIPVKQWQEEAAQAAGEAKGILMQPLWLRRVLEITKEKQRNKQNLQENGRKMKHPLIIR